MNGYPDGCSQADHDRAFGELEPLGDRDRDYDQLEDEAFLEEDEALFMAADAELCAGCGHFLPLAPDGYCGQCEPPAAELKPIAAKVQLAYVASMDATSEVELPGLKSLVTEAKRLQVQPVVQTDVPFPNGKYRCLVVDPPWPMEKLSRDVRPKQGTGRRRK